MIGAIVGDIVGSRFEFANYKSKKFFFFDPDCCFTDDTVVTCCVAESLMKSWEKDKFETLDKVAVDVFHSIGMWYPTCGFGGGFFKWMFSRNPVPYYSCGNGSAMRIGPVIDIARDIEEAKDLSYKITCITHNHPEGIKGAEAVAVAGVLAKKGYTKNEIRRHIEKKYYDLDMSVKDWRAATVGHGKEICQIAVPQAFACFLEGTGFRDTIRNCISTGGDSDTVGAIAGAMAEQYWGVPAKVERQARMYLDEYLLDILDRFEDFKREYADQARMAV